MKYSGHRKLLCELSKLSKFNAFNLLGKLTNTDASILVYKFRPERTGFNIYVEYTQLQLTFLALHSCSKVTFNPLIDLIIENKDSRFQIPDSRFQIPDSRFQIPDFRFQISDLYATVKSGKIGMYASVLY